jgi:hypothetical protein
MDNRNITKRLSRDTSYTKPTQTYQETLTENEIASKLVDYTRVKGPDIFDIQLGSHIRYFIIDQKSGEKQFRLGGNLTKIGDNKKYIVCSNGTFSWSIQLSNSIIYKKLSIDELKEKVKNTAIKESESKIEKVIEDYKELKDENKELKKIIKQIKETTLINKNRKN